MTDPDFLAGHCYLCERPISHADSLVRNGGVQVIMRHGLPRLRAHRSCWIARYGEYREKQEKQAMMDFEGGAGL